MGARVETGWSFHGLTALRLENRWLNLVVLPELGAKILRLTSKLDDTELLWRNPRLTPRRAPYGADFDAFFIGGWDHAFPTLLPSPMGEEVLPYVGELWSLPWRWQVAPGSATAVECSVETVVLPARMSLRIELDDDRASFTMHYRLEHLGYRPFSFMWGLHPCLELDQHTKFTIPASSAIVRQSPDEGVGSVGQRYVWPNLRIDGQSWSMDRAQSPSRCVYGLHELALEDGWFEIERAGGTLMRVKFDHQHFRVLYVWMVYGGWRGIFHAVLEPWTGGGLTLEEAIEAGAALSLAPAEVIETQVRVDVSPGRTP